MSNPHATLDGDSRAARERARLAAMFQQAPAFIALLRGPSCVIELANEAFYELIGRRGVVGKPLAEAVPEIATQPLLAELRAVMERGEAHVASHAPMYLRRSGAPELEHRTVNFVCQPLDASDEGEAGTFLHGVDVTDQVHAAEALRESEQRFRTLVELSPDGILIHVDGKVTFANPAAKRILGAADDAPYAGLNILDFVHPACRADVVQRLTRMSDGKPTPLTEQVWLGIDGRECHVEVSSLPFRLGDRAAVQTVFRDTTQRRHLEEQLRQAQKMEAVGRLAGGVAHDFNNLLTVIKANIEFLLDDLDVSDPRRVEAIDIRGATDRASALTRQLLAFSRKQILQPRVLDLNGSVAAVKPMLMRLIGEDITVETSLAQSLGSVMADPGQIEQVVMNLAVNARDAMPSGGRLMIETANVDLDENYASESRSTVLPGAYVMLAISDTGTGMTREVCARIFEPFFTTKAVGQGTGLGLSTVYGIVKQSGGHIWVYSEPGEGTTFKIYLPRLGQHVASITGETQAARSQPSGSETILLVEDEDALRVIGRRILERHGYTVLDSRNGAEALALATTHPGPIDLVLTDVVMPEMGGGALAERLTAVRPHAALLFMSGYTDGDIVRRGVLEPGVAFVQKPFTPARLLQVVRETLDKRARLLIGS